MKVDPLWLAQSRLRRRRLTESIQACEVCLKHNAADESAWLIRCQALTEQDYTDETEAPEESLADMALGEDIIASAPRPGTSLRHGSSRPRTTAHGFHTSRPITGFATVRKATATGTRSGRQRTANTARLKTGTRSRPLTMCGRRVRLGTQSMLAHADSINVQRFATKKLLSKSLSLFLVHSEKNVRKALELAAECTKQCKFEDWFWKVRLAQCYCAMSLLREGEQQLLSALRVQPMIEIVLLLSNVYVRLDQPSRAMQCLTQGLSKFSAEKHLVLAKARIYEAMNELDQSSALYGSVLRSIEPSCVEAIASLGAQYFYSDKPELAVRYYRRLLEMGVQNTPVWNNLGLSCFFSDQLDLAFPCFVQALALSKDHSTDTADVWFNLSVVAVHMADVVFAQRCLRLCISLCNSHPEAWNNLAVIQRRIGEPTDSDFIRSHECSDGSLIEPCFNAALSAFEQGNCEQAWKLCQHSLTLDSAYSASIELRNRIKHTLHTSL